MKSFVKSQINFRIFMTFHFLLFFLLLWQPIVFGLNPYIYDITNDRPHFDDSDSSTLLSNSRNVTALSTGGTKLLIYGFGFSDDSTLGNQVIIDHSLECEVVNYYTTSNQIQCIVPASNKIGVPLSIQVIVSKNQTAMFYGSSIVNLVYIYDPSLVNRLVPINAPIYQKNITLQLYSSVDTVKGQTFLIALNSNKNQYLCAAQNANQILKRSTNSIVGCNLQNITAPDYYLLSFSIKNGGGVMINSYSSRNLLITQGGLKEYQISFHPVIQKLSTNNGSNLGNFIEVTGTGFVQPLEVNLDGLKLTVLDMNSTYIYLEIPEMTYSLQTEQYYEGNIGGDDLIFYQVYSFDQREAIINGKKPNITQKMLFLNPGTIFTQKYTRIVKTLFRAPYSSKYRFFCSGIDSIQVFMSNVSLSKNRSTLVELCQIANTTDDDFYNHDNQISDWIQLDANGLYYMEIMHINGNSSNDQFKIAVEIDASELTLPVVPDFARPHDVQVVEIFAAFVPEQLLIVMRNINLYLSSFYLVVNSTTSPQIVFTVQESVIAQSLCSFFGAEVDVNITFTDRNNMKVTNYTSAVNFEFLLTFSQGNRNNYSDIPGLVNTSLIAFDKNASTNWTLFRLQMPSEPLSGSYNLTLDGNSSTQINITTNLTDIATIIQSSFDLVNAPVIVQNVNKTIEMISYSVEFKGNPGVFPLLGLNATLITGGLSGGSPNVSIYRIIEGNNNIFINPIGESLLRSPRTYPEITLLSNNVSSICVSDCHYKPFDPSSLPFISSTSISGGQFNYTLVNIASYIDLSVDNFDILIGRNQYCPSNGLQYIPDPNNTNVSTLVCSYSNEDFYAGNFTMKVIFNSFGFLIDRSQDQINLVVPLEVAQVTPLISSVFGGLLLRITGKGFPQSRDLANIKVNINNTECAIEMFNSTDIDCRVTSITYLDKSSQTIGVVLNNQTVNSTFLLEMLNSSTPIISGINTLVLNPWQATQLNISVQNMDWTSQFTIFLQNKTRNITFECTNVQFNSTKNLISCLYYQNGGNLVTGIFSLILRVDNQGDAGVVNISTGILAPINVVIGCVISNISPTSGSLLGGTRISFVGSGFSAGFTAMIGNYSCKIDERSLNSTGFECEIQGINDTLQNGYTKSVDIYYKNTLLISSTQGFSFLSSETLISDTSTVFSSSALYTSNQYFALKISPNNIISTSLKANVFFFSESLNISANISTYAYSNASIPIVIPVLSPDNYTIKVKIDPIGFINLTKSQLTISTVCSGLTLSAGPTKGNIVSLLATSLPNNFSISMQLLDDSLLPMNISLINSTQGFVIFRVPPLTTESSKYKVILVENITKSQICSFAYTVTNDNSKTAQLDAVNIDATTGIVKLTYCCSYYYSTIPSDYELISNATNFSVSAYNVQNTPSYSYVSFDLSAQRPGVYLPSIFSETTGLCELRYQSSSVPTSVQITTNINSLNFNTHSSYAGGNKVVIQGLHFYSKPQINICHLQCKILTANAIQIECQIPEFRTISLLQNHPNLIDIYEELITKATIFSSISNPALEQLIRDFNEDSYFSTGSSNSCYIGLDFGPEARVVITQVGLSLYGQYNSYSSFLNTSVEASQDGVVWTQLFVLSNINDHINYYPVDSDTLTSYRYVRFNDRSSGSQCAIREFRILGILVNQDNTMPSCPINLFFLDSTESPTKDYLSTFSNKTIYFSEDYTPFITTFSPRFYVPGEITQLYVNFNNTVISDTMIYMENNSCVMQNSNHFQMNFTISDFSSTAAKVKVKNSFGFAINLNQDSVIYICQRWSDPLTWDNMKPTTGSSVLIPKGKALVMDESPPPLKMLMVEGVLIASDESDMEIFVEKMVVRNNGSFIAGIAWNGNYQHSLIITLRELQNSSDSSLEDEVTMQYFSKVFSVYGGFLSLKGIPRVSRFCKLNSSALQGDNTIVLNDDCTVKWLANDRLIITGDDYSNEVVYLSQDFDSFNNPNLNTLTLRSNIRNNHLCLEANGQVLCPEIMSMTSNVIIRGDPEQIGSEKSGGYMVIDGFGGVLNTVRIVMVLFQNMGQAMNLGASALLFRDVRTLLQSQILKNTFEDCFNKGFLIKNSNNVKLLYNVVFNVYGHAISTAQGTEANNKLVNNLLTNIKPSVVPISYTDYYSAGIFLTNPANFIKNNIVSFSKVSGFYFYFNSRPDNMYSNSICPKNTIISAFSGNEAHDINTNALQVDTMNQGWVGLSYSCLPVSLNNPQSTIILDSFLAWKITGMGVNIDSIGLFLIQNLQVFNCKVAGVSISSITMDPQLYLQFRNIELELLNYTIIASSSFFVDNSSDYKSSIGVSLPPSEGLVFNGLSFNGFREGGLFYVCSQCTDNDPGQNIRIFNLTIQNCSKVFNFDPKSRNTRILDINGSLSLQPASVILMQWMTHLFANLACQQSNNIPVNASVMVCPISSGSGLLDCGLYNMTGGSLDGSKISFKITNVGNNNLNLQNSQIITAVSAPSVILNQQLTILNGYPTSIWRFFLFSGYNYELEFLEKPSYTGIQLQCSGWKPAFQNFFLKIHYYQSMGFSIAQINTQTGVLSLNLMGTIVFNASNIQYFYNNLDRRTVFLLVTGLLMNANSFLKIRQLNCPGSCCESGRECEVRLWSNASAWPNGMVPQKGDDVTIPYTYRVLIDVNPAVLDQIVVDGELIFDEMMTTSILACNILFVRQGILRIGTSGRPFPYVAKIIATGDNSNTYLYLTSSQRLQKCIAIAGTMNAYGLPRTMIQSKLAEIAQEGSRNIHVLDTIIDWMPDEEIYLVSRENPECSQGFTIVAVTQNGILTLNQTLNCDHFGNATVNTIGDVNLTLDIRSEVFLLSRNIKLFSSGTAGSSVLNSWGGALKILTNNSLSGVLTLNNVEITQFGKNRVNSGSAPIVIDPAIMLTSVSNIQIINSSIYSSFGSSIVLVSSKTIQISNTFLINSVQYGLSITNSDNLIIDNLEITGSSGYRYSILSNDVLVANGLFIVTTNTSLNLLIKNTRVSFFEVGFSIPATFCQGTQISLSNNVAIGNSIKGFIFFFFDPNCNLISSLVAYKNQEGVYSFSSTAKLLINTLILASNNLGLNTNKATTFNDSSTIITGIVLVGPNNLNCMNYTGIQIPLTLENPRSYPPDQSTVQNWNSLGFYTNFHDETWLINATLLNFTNTTNCSIATLFKTNPYASDFSSPVNIKGTKKVNSDEFIFASFDQPNIEWISPMYCGNFQCTGLYNVLIKDLDGSVFSSPASIIPEIGNSNYIQAFQCGGLDQNSLFCPGNTFAISLFDSLDLDSMTRSLAPVFINNTEFGTNSVLNGFMDHFYNIYSIYSYRYNRFPGIVRLNTTYNITFSQPNPITTRFKLSAAKPEDYLILRVNYGSVKKLVEIRYAGNNSLIPNNLTYNQSSSGLEIICGRNFLDPQLKYIEFVITGEQNCTLVLLVKNSVIMEMHVNQNYNQFARNLSNFSTQVTNFLNINTSNWKNLDLTAGSAILSFAMMGFTANQNSSQLSQDTNVLIGLTRKLTDGIVTGSLNLGSNIISLNYTTSFQTISSVSQGSANVVNNAVICDLTSVDTNNNKNDNISQNTTNITNSTVSNLSNRTSNNNTNQTTNNTNTNNNLINITIVNNTNHTTNYSSNSSDKNSNSNDNVNIGIILGSVFGGAITGIIICVCWKRWKKLRRNTRNFSQQDLEIVEKYYSKRLDG